MIKKFFFLSLIIILGWGFFISPTFKEVAAGVAVLLTGMVMLEEGFNAFVQGPLQKLLQKATNKLYKSLSMGFVVTTLLQSSSLISVITISFLSAGLLGLKAGIGIIFGANIGSTTTAWLVAMFGLKIDIAAFSMPLISFGVLFFFQKRKSLKGLGKVLTGLGFFFLGIHFMKEGFNSYQDSINLADYAIPGIRGLVVYMLIGMLVTIILQSSGATMALILTALAVGQITYENSLALAIGANIGTTITAILGSLSANIAGKRLAAAHVVFNMITAILALAFIYPLGQLVNLVSDGMGFATDNYTYKLSIFHTVFNVVGVLVMVPLLNPLVKVLERVFKEKEDEHTIEYPKFLNESIMKFPHSAIRALLNESKRLLEKTTFLIVSHGLNLHQKDIIGEEKLGSIVTRSREELYINIDELYYNKVKIIYGEIISYCTMAQSKFSLSTEMMEIFSKIKVANRNMVEVIKDCSGLRKNVLLYQNSDNKYIQTEYDRLRRRTSRVLREIYRTRDDENPALHFEKLEKLKLKAAKGDVLANGNLDTLIREHKINSKMASSLANDSDNVNRICKLLIETAELLYIQSDTLLRTYSSGEKEVI